jgi:hypothetical protein
MRLTLLSAPILGILCVALGAGAISAGCDGSDATGDDVPQLDPTPVVGTNPTGTFAGPAEDGDTYVAVVAGEELLLVYVCDGKSVSQWFQVQTQGLPAVARNAAGTTLEIGPSDKGLAGQLVAADESWNLAFDVPADPKAKLFRGSSGVDGTRVVGGWIRLGDGSQRGAVTLTDKDGNTTLGSTVDELGVPATTKMELPGTFNVSEPAPNLEALSTFNSPFDFNVVGLGDSYGAGEGAPKTAGNHCLPEHFDDIETKCSSDDECSSKNFEPSGFFDFDECKPPTACLEPVTWDQDDPASK